MSAPMAWGKMLGTFIGWALWSSRHIASLTLSSTNLLGAALLKERTFWSTREGLASP